MNKMYYIGFFLIVSTILNVNLCAQFPNPEGDNGTISDFSKKINKNRHFCWPLPEAFSDKQNSPRRWKFDATFHSNCWHDEDLLPNGTGWNKIGKVVGLNEGINENWYKLTVGWRMLYINEVQTLGLGLFAHTRDEKLDHWLDSIPFYTETDISIDMYLYRNIIALVVGDKSIAIRNAFSSEFWDVSSLLRKAVYFGGNSKAPHDMDFDFKNNFYDYPGFDFNFNSSNYMIWNLSKFVYGDDFTFFAYKLIEGSQETSSPVVHKPSFILSKQTCVIESGADISFQSGERILLHKGFHAKSDSRFHASICPQIRVFSWPNVYEYPMIYTVQNATSAVLVVHYFDIDDGWLFVDSFVGEFNGNEVSFGSKSPLPPENKYRCQATFSNDCQQKTFTTIYIDESPISKISLVDSLTNVEISILKSGNNTSDDFSFNKFSAIENNEVKKELFLYPNPTNDIINFDFSTNETETISKIYIYDSYGNIVYDNENVNSILFSVNLYHFVSGVYIAKIISENSIFVEKFFIVK